MESSAAPKITVVIAAYNAERFIGQTLDSVFAQTLHEIELIVVEKSDRQRSAWA
jgi:glycosyltransferase involved in cell wall biosynthesis